MTLKQFLEENKIEVTNEQRSKIGYSLKYLRKGVRYVDEGDYQVRDYDKSFFESSEVQRRIINVLT